MAIHSYRPSGRSRWRRLALVTVLVLALSLTVTGALDGVSAFARRGGVTGDASYDHQPPPRAPNAHAETSRALQLPGVVLVQLLESPPSAPENPEHGRPAPRQPNTTAAIEYATVTVQATASGAAEFVVERVQVVPVPARASARDALAQAELNAERATANSVAQWLSRSGARHVPELDVREASATLRDSVEYAREIADGATRFACPSGAGSACVGVDHVLRLRETYAAR